MERIKTKIKKLIDQDLSKLDDNLKTWVMDNLIEPKKEILISDLDTKETKELWIITSDKDSSYRVTFDETNDYFGLYCQLEDGTVWYMGAYGEFCETIKSM
jgi:hypothetical protein